MTDLVTFLDKHVKSSVYTGVYIHVIYRYLEIIGSPKTFTASVQISHHFSPLSSINNYTESLQPVIANIRAIQMSIFECCGRIEHKSDACIIRGPKVLSPNIRIKTNQLNALHGD